MRTVSERLRKMSHGDEYEAMRSRYSPLFSSGPDREFDTALQKIFFSLYCLFSVFVGVRFVGFSTSFVSML